MSIADKLIYLNGTKDKLKESINNIGGSITDETTFRAYATELDNIYTSLPKTTGEGSNLSLNTLKGRINVDDILGDTTQEGTPTPTTPIDINVVTGTQEVVVENKNSANVNATQIGKAWNNASNSARAILVLPIEHNTQYTISYGSLGSLEGIYYGYRTEEETAGTGVTQMSTNPLTITTNDTNNYIIFQFNKTSISLADIQAINLQLEKGSTQTDFVPYQEQTQQLRLGDIELAKIGTYVDRIYKEKDKWYIEKKIGKLILSTLSWETTSVTSAFLVRNIYSRSTGGYCNCYTKTSVSSATWTSMGNNEFFVRNANAQLLIKDTNYTTTSAFVTSLSGHNAVLYYVLATPTYEEITNETLLNELNELEKMYSYSGQTNISVSGNLPMIIDVTALKGE